MSLKKKAGHVVSLHGHRGSRATHPENTLPAFQEAIAVGCDYFELDVHLSKDDVPFVFHDDFISDRVCAGVTSPRAVRTLSMSELETFDIGLCPQPRFPAQKLEKGLRITSLEAVLKLARGSGTGVNIELKSEADGSGPDPEHYARRVAEVIRQTGMTEEVIVQSFDFRPLEFFRRLEPKIDLSYLFETDRTEFAERAIALKAKIVGPFFSVITAENLARCHAHAIKVVPWTVNEKADWDKLIAWGIDGIITDFPRALAAQWTP